MNKKVVQGYNKMNLLEEYIKDKNATAIKEAEKKGATVTFLLVSDPWYWKEFSIFNVKELEEFLDESGDASKAVHFLPCLVPKK
jgi:hypothetical protein